MINTIPSATLLFSMPGGSEWIFIVIIVLLLFGGKKIPDLMRGIGKGIREFKDAKDQVSSEIREGMKEGSVSNEKNITAVKA
jgi:sec-independent protein translocase protein TatA